MPDLLKHFKKIYPESPKNKALVFLFSLIFLSCFATYYFFSKEQNTVPLETPEAKLSRDYYRSPLNMSDAYQYCLLEAEKQLGSALLRHALDPISTHYKEDKAIFFVVLKVDVGSVKDFREAAIYCNVDPRQYKVSYYKEVYPGEGRSILSRTIEFFSKL